MSSTFFERNFRLNPGWLGFANHTVRIDVFSAWRTGVFAAFSGGKIFSISRIFCTDQRGANCVSVFALTGRLLFCIDCAGCLNCVSEFALSGRRVFAGTSAGIRRLRTAGTCRAPRRWAKGRTTCGFPSLNSYFPCFLIWRRFPICDRFEIGTAVGLLFAFVSNIRSSQTDYCHT